MKYGIDVDGVLADFNLSYELLTIDLTGQNLFPGGVPYAPPCWYYLTPLGYTKEHESFVWDHINRDDSFWANLPAYGETPGILARLKEMSYEHDIYFITTRTGIHPKSQTERWLEYHGYQKPTVLVSSNKGFIAEGLELDYFIDDRDKNCEAVLNARGVKCDVWILDRSWNRGFYHKYINRANSVHQFLDYTLKVEALSGGN